MAVIAKPDIIGQQLLSHVKSDFSLMLLYTGSLR